MAQINIYNNCFEEKHKTIEYDKNKSIIEQIEENIDCNEYKNEMVECYDPFTENTFFAPLEDESKPSVLITVNNKSVSEDYKVKDTDVMNVYFLPMGEGFGNAFSTFISGGAIGGSIGSFFGPAGIVIGAFAGFFLGFVISARQEYILGHSSTTNKGQKEGESLPDIKGASNKSILNQPYPFVIGKRLVTLSVVGDPYTEYTNNGQDAYIRILYCAGYGPLKLTDFKLGDFYLAYNRTHGVQRKTILSGLLKGYSTAQADDGDILDRWKNNDVELEILQHNPNKPVNHGTIYQSVKAEREIKANILFVNDDLLTEEAKITYKGITFAERFRTNTVVFTESCPMAFTVNLDALNGLYETHTHTSKSGNNTLNETVYNSIPLWFAVQWRFYDSNNDSSDSEGGDYGQWNNITEWNGNSSVTQVYSAENHTADINAHKGNSITSTVTQKRVDTVIEQENIVDTLQGIIDTSQYSTDLDCINETGSDANGLVLWTSETSYQYIAKGNKAELPDSLHWCRLRHSTSDKRYCVYDSENQTLWIDLSYDGETFSDTVTSRGSSEVISYNFGEGIEVELYDYKAVNNSSQVGSDGIQYTANVKYIKTVKKYYISSMSNCYSDTGFWVGKELVNFQSFSGEDYIGETRLSATVTLTKEQCKQMLKNSNTIKGIEVRCIRVSANYMNETSSQTGRDSGDSARSYSDSITLTTIVTESFNKEKLMNEDVLEAVNAVSDEDLKKFCYVALKVKADSSGNILSQLKELNCIAQSFSPVYNETTHKIIPENVRKVTKYYGYYTDNTMETKCSRNKDAYEVYLGDDEEAKLEYENARHEGYYWYAEMAGSNYVDKISEIVFPSDDSYYSVHNEQACNYLPPKSELNNDATAASGFLLSCVGPHNGVTAMGYEDVNLLSFIDTWQYQQKIKDGSTYSESDSKHSAGDEVEVKYEANGYVYQSLKLEDLLKKIAVAGRFGFTYDEAGKIKMIMDKPVDYAKGSITQQNTISLTSSYNYEEPPAGLRITFNDEKDGYEANGIYCWADGNSLSNYKGQVKPYQFDFVTNEEQIWSLGRWVLANILLNWETINAKCGVEGNTYELGDVIVLQSDELLIGKGSGRIQQIIEDDDYIYGFITDSVFEYTNETETVEGEDKSKLGFSVFQQKKTGDKVSTFRIAVEGTSCTIDEITYVQTVGQTNLLLLDNFISKSTPNVYRFSLNDILMYGYYQKETDRYRIVKIKPEKNNFTYTLVKYDEQIYNYGRALPSFQNYMTVPQPSKEGITLSEVPTTISDFDKKALGNTTFLINGSVYTVSIDNNGIDTITKTLEQNGVYSSSVDKLSYKFVAELHDKTTEAFRGYYKFSAFDGTSWIQKSSGAGNSFEYTVDEMYYTAYMLELYADSEYSNLIDKDIVTVLFDDKELRVDLSNDNVSLLTDSTGITSDFSATPTGIKAYLGLTSLIFSSNSSVHEVGKFYVNVTNTNCTGGTVSDDSGNAICSAITAISDNHAERLFKVYTYIYRLKISSINTFPFIKIEKVMEKKTVEISQTISKVRNGNKFEVAYAVGAKGLDVTDTTIMESLTWLPTMPSRTKSQSIYMRTQLIN